MVYVDQVSSRHRGGHEEDDGEFTEIVKQSSDSYKQKIHRSNSVYLKPRV
jgi:hypothetical protein